MPIKPKISLVGPEHYIGLLDRKVPWSFTRYWDGELAAIIGRDGKNCDGSSYRDELREGLRKSITNNHPYYHALYLPDWHPGTTNLRSQFCDWLEKVGSRVQWVDFMVWQRAIERGAFKPILDALNRRGVVLVSGAHLFGAVAFLKCAKVIEIPKVDAIREKEKIERDILEVCEVASHPVFLFAAGMATNVIIDELFPIVGKRATMIDMGSVFDALLNLPTRKWIRDKMTQEIIRKNIKG